MIRLELAKLPYTI